MRARSLISQLQRKHECRDVMPWGSVVIVPASKWQPTWLFQLQREGCKVFKNRKRQYLVKPNFNFKAVPSKSKVVPSKPKPKPKQPQRERQPQQKRAYKHWSITEESILRKLYAEGKLHIREIAERLNRTLKSVEQRAFKLGVRSPQANMPWSNEDKAALKRLRRKGRLKIKEIAEEIGRTRKAVEQKIYKLNKPQKQNEYVLTERMKRRLERLGKLVTCYRCEKTLKIGDKLVTRRANTPSSFKIYHRSCWESMFIEA